MRVLWFTGNPAMYQAKCKNISFGGGWTASLQNEIITKYEERIILGVAIPWEENFDQIIDNTYYYGIKKSTSIWYNYNKKEQRELQRVKQVVENFVPDIIHVFGSEHMHGLVSTLTSVPVVIHIQGIMNAYEKLWLPQNLSWWLYYFFDYHSFFDRLNLKVQVLREKRIFANCKYFMGRTHWDKSCCELLAPNAEYFYCSEMLRPTIYYSKKLWTQHQAHCKKIATLISKPIYKGSDIVLRTAKTLIENGFVDFEWIVYGVDNFDITEKITGLKSIDCNVKAGGIVNPDQLVESLTSADVYVHPSYIENSPNSVCEAQVLGVPVISLNVGGVSTLLDDGKAGILVGSGDIIALASLIKKVLTDSSLAEKLSKAGRDIALVRHSPECILKDVVNIYQKITRQSL